MKKIRIRLPKSRKRKAAEKRIAVIEEAKKKLVRRLNNGHEQRK